MAVLNFILALVALIIAILAYQRSGWTGDLKNQIDTLGTIADTLREKTANALSRIEKALRKEENKEEDKKKAAAESEETRNL